VAGRWIWLRWRPKSLRRVERVDGSWRAPIHPTKRPSTVEGDAAKERQKRYRG